MIACLRGLSNFLIPLDFPQNRIVSELVEKNEVFWFSGIAFQPEQIMMNFLYFEYICVNFSNMTFGHF